MTEDLAGLRRAAPDRPESARVPPPRRRWKTRVLVPALALLGFAAVLLYAMRDALAPRLPVRVVPVVVKGGGADAGGAVISQAAGWIEPDPYPIYVSALSDGVVEEVLVLEGEAVEAGQVVVRMVREDAELALARAEAERMDLAARVAAAEAELAAAERDWDHPVERDRAVAAAEARAAAADADQLAAMRDATSAELFLAEAQDVLRRAEIDFENGAIAEQQVVQARLRREAAAAALDAARARVTAAESRVAEARAEVVAARENLALRIPEKLALERSRAELDQARAALRDAEARRDEAALRLARMDVRAPTAGLVMARLASPGQKLMLAGDMPHSAHAVHLYDPAKLQVRVDVPLGDAAAVGVGQQAVVTAEVLPDRAFDGVVTRIVHQADIQKNTLQVKVAIVDPAPELKPEMLARVQFLSRAGAGEEPHGSRPSERVFAPERLVRGTGAGAVVWIVDKGESEATRRTVTLGASRQGGWVEVVEGLRPGDLLIDLDPAQLEEGRTVEIVGESAAADDAHAAGGHR